MALSWKVTLLKAISTQHTELVTLTQALRLGRGKRNNIYIDRWYTFAIIHVYEAL